MLERFDRHNCVTESADGHDHQSGCNHNQGIDDNCGTHHDRASDNNHG
jgi:hypothetical protein